MSDLAPKVQRQRRQRRQRNNGAAPTADATPSGVNGVRVRRRNLRRRRRAGNNVVAITQNPAVTTRRFIHREIKREIKREGLEGPKVAVQQRITSTFGIIGPNVSGNTELELNFFCHPSLAKEANDGTAFGPLQALAAQYALWKIKYLTLRFTPMVGASAVSGTVVRASLNLSQSPGGSNWSGLGTRIHHDMHPGQSAVFHLRGDQVGGPRDGGWWFTDTNEEGSQSAGPIVEVHTLGETMSTFKDDQWKGPLFLVEGIGVWQFANYQVKPALGQLERREADVQADINAEAGQPITMELPEASDMALFMDALEPELYNPDARVATQSVGETIFQVVDVGAQLAESAAPPPFNWLIKGGWWFVKKLLGRQRAGKSTYLVYASLSDAQNNKPCIATGTVDTNAVNTKLLVTQINSPNVGPSLPGAASTRNGPQTLYPGMRFRLHSEAISEAIISTGPTGAAKLQIPVSAIPGIERDSNGTPSTSSSNTAWIQTPWWVGAPGRAPDSSSYTSPPSSATGGYIHSLYRLINPRFTDQTGALEYFHPPPTSGVNFCMINSFNNNGTPSPTNPYAVYGEVVATNLIQSGATPPLSMVITLIRTTTEFRHDEDTVRDLVAVIGDNAGQAIVKDLPHIGQATSWQLTERTIPVGTYLLGVSYTNDPKVILGVDIPTTLLELTYQRTESPIAAIFPYNLSGQMFAATSVDLTLRMIESQEVDTKLLDQLRLLNVNYQPPQLPPLPVPRVDLSDPTEAWWPHDSKESDDESSEDSETEFWRVLGENMVRVPTRYRAIMDIPECE